MLMAEAEAEVGVAFLTCLESFLPHVTVLMHPLIIPTISSPNSATYIHYTKTTQSDKGRRRG